MRYTIVCFFLTVATTHFLHAQSSRFKTTVSGGGGFEQYRGDLGNAFFDWDVEWYGFARLQFGRYLTRSFDVNLYGSLGEYGHCTDIMPDPETHVLMMRSRLGTVGAICKYKFANGYLLKEKSVVAPFVLAGLGWNYLTDIWTTQHERVNEGAYGTLHAGAGLYYHISSRIQFEYQIGLGYFMSDRLDFIQKGAHDMYLQQAFMLGYNF